MGYKRMGTNGTSAQTLQNYVLGSGLVSSIFFLLSCDIILNFLLHFLEKCYYAIILVHYFLRMKIIDYLQEIKI